MAVQIAFEDILITLNEQINYNFQTANVGDLSLSKSNYTSSFNIPRVVENQQFFDGLGIPGDRSDVPYVAHKVDILEDYMPVYSGTLVILKTTKLYYTATVVSGAFDFFSVLADKKFSDIDITEIIHAKTPQNVANAITSTSGREYAYFVGRFSDNPYFNNGLNVDAMPVAVKLQYLLDKIFEHAQMTYSLPSSANLANQFMTFPYPPYLEVGAAGGDVFSLIKNTQNFLLQGQYLQSSENRDQYANWDSTSGLGFTTVGFDIVAIGGGQTLFNFEQCIVQVRDIPGSYIVPVECVLIDTANDYEFARFTTDTINGYDGDDTYRTVYNVRPGGRIRIEFRYRNPNTSVPKAVNFQSIILRLSSLDMSTDGLNKVYGFGLSDFIKEMMFRYTLIPIQNGTHVNFISLNDIIQIEGVTDYIDWTDKYIEREEESYDAGYAQNNYLKHKYANENENVYDRNLQSDNKTLPISNDMIVSKVFAPPISLSEITPDQTLPSNIVESFDWETYEVQLGNGGTSASVKTENRHYFVSISQDTGMQIRLESPSLPGDTVVQPFQMNVGNYTAGFVINPRWNSLIPLLTNTRQHIIKLHLTQEDIRTLDQTKPYYFDQEQAYYVLSKLQYQKGQIAKGEFIKINY